MEMCEEGERKSKGTSHIYWKESAWSNIRMRSVILARSFWHVLWIQKNSKSCN